MNRIVIRTLRVARMLTVLVIGSTVVLVGVVLIVTPGPAFLVIPLGIAILATEFVWARRLLKRMKQQGTQWVNAALRTNRNNEPPQESAESSARASPTAQESSQGKKI